MTQYVALLYYDRNQYWDSPPETEFAPEYTEFARRATAAGVMRGGEALHPVTMSTTITPRRRRSWVDTSCWTWPTSTRPSPGRRRTRARGGGRSSFAR